MECTWWALAVTSRQGTSNFLSTCYLPNFSEPCAFLWKLVDSKYSLLQAHSNSAIWSHSCDSYLSFLVSKLTWSSNCLAHTYGCLDTCYCPGKLRTAQLLPFSEESCTDLSENFLTKYTYRHNLEILNNRIWDNSGRNFISISTLDVSITKYFIISQLWLHLHSY